jgi:hypothetical protein
MKLNIKQFSLLFTWTVALPFFRSDVAWGEMCLIKRGWRLDASPSYAGPASRDHDLCPPSIMCTVVYFLSYLPCNIFLSFFLFVPAFCLFISVLLVPAVSVFVETWCFQGGDDLDCIQVGSYQFFGEACFRFLGSEFCLRYGGRIILWSANTHLQN